MMSFRESKIVSRGAFLFSVIVVASYLCVCVQCQGTPVDVNDNKEYFLATGETAKFGCDDGKVATTLKYTAGKAADDNAAFDVSKTGAKTIVCDEAYGKAAAGTADAKDSDKKVKSAPMTKAFECKGTGAKATVYCAIVDSNNPGGGGTSSAFEKSGSILTTGAVSLAAILSFFF